MDRCPIEGGASTPAGDKKLISHGVIDDTDNRESGLLERYRDGECRQPMSKIGRTVQWIDNPAKRRAGGCADTALFAEEVVLRAEGAKPVRDEIFRRPVGFSHQVDGALEPHVVWLTETVTEDLTRVTGDLHRLVGVIVQQYVHD